MSFVLEALKKQEAGQDPAAAVSLARQAVERRRHRLWVGLFAVAVMVNAGLLLWMFGVPWLQTRTADPAEAGIAPAATEQPVTNARPAATAKPAATERPAAKQAPAANERPGAKQEPAAEPQPAPTREPTETPPQIRTVSLQNLPADARARFPGIAFSTHIYSDDPDLRAIVANGQRLQEGDRIRGLEIVAITEGGVLLAFENYRVEVPIVTDW